VRRRQDEPTGETVPDRKAVGEKVDDGAREKAKVYEVGYTHFRIDGHMLGHGEPRRVKQGEGVQFQLLNGSATEIRSQVLPRHSFRIMALDENPVPKQAEVPALRLGTAERVSAIVETKHLGVWIFEN